MKYRATYKWEKFNLEFSPKYDPMDFLRNNDDINFFTIENWEPKIDMEWVINVMVELYREMLEDNYL